MTSSGVSRSSLSLNTKNVPPSLSHQPRGKVSHHHQAQIFSFTRKNPLHFEHFDLTKTTPVPKARCGLLPPHTCVFVGRFLTFLGGSWSRSEPLHPCTPGTWAPTRPSSNPCMEMRHQTLHYPAGRQKRNPAEPHSLPDCSLGRSIAENDATLALFPLPVFSTFLNCS